MPATNDAPRLRPVHNPRDHPLQPVHHLALPPHTEALVVASSPPSPLMTYNRRIDRAHPTCLAFLVDQSDSMQEPLAEDPSRSKSQAVASILNGTLYELVLRCVKSPQEGPRPYFGVMVIGYGTDAAGHPRVTSALPERADGDDLWWSPELAERPLRVERRTTAGGTGQVASPVWVEPHAAGGTPMCAAFDRVGRRLQAWIQQHPDSFPPIVLNLTDGEATDGDPTVWAQRLCSLATSDGSTLLFNAHLSSDRSAPLLFPPSDAGLPNGFAATLYAMSSFLPTVMVDAANAQGLSAGLSSRGFSFNADVRNIVTFLNVGTSVGRLLR